GYRQIDVNTVEQKTLQQTLPQLVSVNYAMLTVNQYGIAVSQQRQVTGQHGGKTVTVHDVIVMLLQMAAHNGHRIRHPGGGMIEEYPGGSRHDAVCQLTPG